ncbi:MAG: N-acetylmuramoyl-L-alanine amidase-like domain-containing protein [Dissulfurispiraceae bacterium]
MELLGKWTRDSLDNMLRKSSSYITPGKRIRYISSFFLGVAYKESTLTGDSRTPEVFVINFQGVDCFTFIEYVEAMRLSGSFQEFEKCLKKIRYRSGKVAFTARKHFFTDWSEFNRDFVDDVTRLAGGQKTVLVRKQLNKKDDGTAFLCGIEPYGREISYIPSFTLTDRVVNNLKTGDYIGIYSGTSGLDVSHVGIFIKTRGETYLRHASSVKSQKTVIDQDFKSYVTAKPGIVVLRPK